MTIVEMSITSSLSLNDWQGRTSSYFRFQAERQDEAAIRRLTTIVTKRFGGGVVGA
jgi:hypothetical protein